jgi:hypothetical protein
MEKLEEAEQGSSEPHVRTFVTLCLSGPEEMCRKAIPAITQLGFYQTGEKEDEQRPGLFRVYFSMHTEDILSLSRKQKP